MKKYSIVIFIFFSYTSIIDAQEKTNFTLQHVIEQAQDKSLKAKLAQTQKELSYYQFVTYKSDLNPQISLYGNLPVYNKEYFSVRQPDGSIKFQSISQSNSNLGFSLSQQLPFSGGELSLNTDLTRFDDFKGRIKQYSSTPIFLKLTQPLFGTNELKWKKKIEPLKLEESKKQYIQDIENIAQQAIGFYFDVIDAQNNMQIAQSGLLVSQTNYNIETKRINLGTTTEDKLLQLELQTLRSKQDLEKARYNYRKAQLNLKTFIGIKNNEELDLLVPQIIPIFTIDMEEALKYAKENRPEFIAFERKKQEAFRDVAIAKSAKQQANLTASYGLNNSGNNLSTAYKNPNDQQRFSFGFNIPFLDWGRRKARYNTAKSLEKLILTTNEFDEITIFQEITALITDMKLLSSNILLAQKTDSVAHRRFNIANNLYQSGKLSITDISLAQGEKDNARREYIGALRAYWDGYYLLRRVTLYDFEKKKSLVLPK
ncbi:TolC family protein [Pedobacter sp. Hv1]|uniref:TolC family protein n=1 Tax=Pedobacter sp. Hv1 TaxID=1740090 RepID=UPI0006D8D385|nr:TolC family protein [Pedobacter sp. Hv1]KQB99416.1 hypothetical protein AQF98_17760 [Pedobacter sp. Hv1]